jgi:outer membrane protein TolC
VIRACLATAAALVLGGCASYRPQPVDLAAFDAQWRNRPHQGGTIAAFAEDLERRGALAPLRLSLDDGVDLAEAEVLALLWNPGLRQARAAAGVPIATAAHAGTWAAPELGIDALHALDSVARPWTLASALSITLPLSGRLGLEREHAAQVAAGARLDLLAREWSTLAALRDAWLTWSALSVEQLQAATLRDDLAALADHAARLAAAGELSVVAARTVRVAAVQADDAARARAGEAALQRLGLLALLGLAPEAHLVLHPTLRLDEALMQRLGDDALWQDPRLRQAIAEHRISEARLRWEVRRQYPDLRLGLAIEDDRGDRALGPVLGLSLPLWQTQAGPIAEAEAARQASAAAIEADYVTAVSERAQARLALEDRRTRLAHLEQALVPLIDAQLADSRRQAELGDLDVALMLEVLDRAAACRRELVRLRAELALAHNRLLAMTLPHWMSDQVANAQEERP